MRSSISCAPPTTKNVTIPETSQRPLGDVLNWAAGRLSEAGTPTPRSEATRLWALLWGTNPGEVWLSKGRSVDDDALVRFQTAVRRRAEGAPLEYAAGRAAFRHLDLVVDESVLIPRPETEGLVQHVLDWSTREDRWGSVLDLGVGSGCIVVSLATEGRYRHLVGTDLSPDALAVAADNTRRLVAGTPVELCVGDLYEPVGARRFDVIVSNPPYVAPAEFDALEAGVRGWEPRAALVSENEGLEHIRVICAGATERLNDGGLLALEIDARRWREALAAARDAGFSGADVAADVFGRPRYLLAGAGG